MINHPKIGRYTPEGTLYPTETITGKPYARGEFDPPPAIVHMLQDGYFVIGEVFLPRGFDVEVELDLLRSVIADVRVTVATDNFTGETVVVPSFTAKKEDKS